MYCCFTAGLKSSMIYLSKLTNSKQPSRRNAKVKRQVCYLKTSSTSLYNNAYKNSLNSDEKSIFFAVNNLLRFSTPQFTQISSVMEQILRKYVQLFEFSEFPWHILRDIFLPQDRKTIKKDSRFLLSTDGRSFTKVFHCYQPSEEEALSTSVDFDQILWHFSNSQSALRPKSGRSEHKRERVCISPILAGAHKMRFWSPSMLKSAL